MVDPGVVFPPTKPLPSVRQDAGALDVLTAYRHAAGTDTWTGIEATGKIVPEEIHGVGANASQDASLWILGHQGSRLDIQTPRGVISIRIDGTSGGMQRPNGRITPIDAADAVTGLVAFPELQDSTFPASSISLIDQGTVYVDRVGLHRITMEVPWTHTTSSGMQRSGISITDLYFDPKTHMLVKSANILQGTDTKLALYMKVVTYGDYRARDNTHIPYLISESLNGRQVWMLQIDHVKFIRRIDGELFHF